jgi:DNA-binding MurR/RpiR family transcriptional regulator
MTSDLQKKLKSRWETFTTSEQKLATYLLHNISGIPFETAASLGKRVGVSAMTVGRFLRNLGYEGVGDLKEELRDDAPWKQLYRKPEQQEDADFISENLQAEIRGLTDAHALARTGEWKAIVKMLVSAERVSVASFQHGRFLGMGFASMLQHVKPNTVFADGYDGSYADVLLDSNGKSCVVLIDVRRYSRHFRLLAEEVSARGIPLVIVTDTQCYWARQLTDNVLMLAIHPERAWHSLCAFDSLLSLLISAVIREQGDALERIGEITRLRQKFIGYVGAPGSDRYADAELAKGRDATKKGKPTNKGRRATATRKRLGKPAR